MRRLRSSKLRTIRSIYTMHFTKYPGLAVDTLDLQLSILSCSPHQSFTHQRPHSNCRHPLQLQTSGKFFVIFLVNFSHTPYWMSGIWYSCWSPLPGTCSNNKFICRQYSSNFKTTFIESASVISVLGIALSI